MVNAVEAFDAKHMKPAEEIPAFRPGDTVDVNVKIKEGNNSRIQTFTGVVIARQGSGLRETFLVRKISFGTGVERRFPLHSPSIDSIKLVRKGRVRRAKLYYLRKLRGKAASHRRASRQLRQGDSGLSFAKRGDSTVKFSPEPIGSGLNLQERR